MHLQIANRPSINLIPIQPRSLQNTLIDHPLQIMPGPSLQSLKIASSPWHHSHLLFLPSLTTSPTHPAQQQHLQHLTAGEHWAGPLVPPGATSPPLPPQPADRSDPESWHAALLENSAHRPPGFRRSASPYSG